jgi:four helix bundle protein
VNENELKARLKQFALRTMRLVRHLPRNAEGRAIAGQLVRCGTAVGANYRSACRARSKAEFVARLAIAEDEADECAYWLELIIEGGIMEKQLVQPLLGEANEIVAILTASHKSASRTKEQKPSRSI